MPNFDINSRFNNEANFSQVVFGEDGYVLETELNEMQHIQDEARASLIRESIPSGVLNYFEPTMLHTTPNAFKLGDEMKVNIYGQILTIPKDTTIQLNEPPTADFQSVTGKVGYREDLVFLEAWKEEVTFNSTINKFGGEGAGTVTNTIKDTRVGVETTRRIQWKWRIRVVDDVDFNKFRRDGFTTNVSSADNRNNFLPQGGNKTPIDNSFLEDTLYSLAFTWASFCSSPSRKSALESSKLSQDVGLIVGGVGDSGCKSILKTADGYVYAIPLFRVKRRNSGGYSVENGNGAIKGYLGKINRLDTFYNESSGKTPTQGRWVLSSTAYNIVKVNDIITTKGYSDSYKLKVVSKDGSNTITVKGVGQSSTAYNNSIADIYFITSDRPDLCYSDLIESRDIIDLRHKVSLTGFNYKELLEKNFEKLISGELGTKDGKKMLKTYHGIRKTPIDSNTIFYASLDGTTKPEVGEMSDISVLLTNFEYSPTGLGASFKNTCHFKVAVSNLDQVTVDLMVEREGLKSNSSASIPLDFSTVDGNSFGIRNLSPTGYNLMVYFGSDNNTKTVTIPNQLLNLKFWHLRFTYNNNTKNLRVYICGNLLLDCTGGYNLSKCTRITLGHPTSGWGYMGIMSDVSISNIDRGDNFATLPKDFIDDYATISNAFNEQRETFGDPTMSQTCQEVIKCTGETKRQFTITKSGTNWASGDTIKVKGLGSEVITGVIDTDTAIATIVKADGTATATLSSVTGIASGDTLQAHSKINSTSTLTVSSVDTVNKKVTFTQSITASWENATLYETTPSSSSPVLKYMNGSTPTDVTGTWTGLGTNEVTFTFGENATLTNQDLEIQYSLNAPSGQGGISEVLTETLGGEYKGKKLTKQSNILITDDFKGKVLSSFSECPHKALAQYTKSDIGLVGSEFNQSNYGFLSTLDGGKVQTSSGASPNIVPHHIFEIDLIRMVEDKFGEIPSVDKVKWLKDNVYRCKVTVYGHGRCPVSTNSNVYQNAPEGMLYKIAMYNTQTSSWTKVGWSQYHTSDSPRMIYMELDSTNSNEFAKPEQNINSSGKVTVVAYTNPSDSSTGSYIFTDYVSIDLTLKSESGFDILAPENTRRDDGLSGALLVRKETKEIRRYPLGKAKETDGIVTYGDYVPYQGSISQNTYYNLVANKDLAYVTSCSTSKPYPKGVRYSGNIMCHVPMCFRDWEYLSDNEPVQIKGREGITTYADNVGNVTTTPIVGSYRCRSLSFIGKNVGYSSTPVFRGLSATGSSGFYDSILFNSLSSSSSAPRFLLFPTLVYYNGELMLCVVTAISKNGMLDLSVQNNTSHVCLDVFRLNGSPLVKEVF